MSLLLDTHAVLWLLTDDRRFSTKVKERILSGEDVAWSIVSLWEIGIKTSLRRSDFSVPKNWDRLIPAEMKHNEIQLLDISPAHCLAVSELPWHHRDPFDRLLIAQATAENRALVSADSRIDLYEVDRIW